MTSTPLAQQFRFANGTDNDLTETLATADQEKTTERDKRMTNYASQDSF